MSFINKLLLAYLSLSLLACGGVDSKRMMSPSSIIAGKQHVMLVLKQKGVKDGDEIVVRFGSHSLYEGRYDRKGSSGDKLSLLTQVAHNHRSYLNLSYDSIRAVYLPREAEAVKRKMAETKQQHLSENLLREGIRDNQGDKVRQAVKQGAALNPNTYRTPLLEAASIENRADIIRLLARLGAKPNHTDKNGRTPLHAAIQMQHFDNARALIEAGADPMFRSSSNGLPPAVEAFTGLRWANKEQLEAITAFVDYLVKEKHVDPNVQWEDPVYKADNALGMSNERLLLLSQKDCLALLDKHSVQYELLDNTKGVGIPLRLKSTVAGVAYRHTGNSKKFSVMDCRLVVALIGIGPVLQKYNIVDIQHMRAYAPDARIGGKGNVSGHSFALAIDFAVATTSEGDEYSVVEDWTDRRRGVSPCEAQDGDGEKQILLRQLICDINKQGLFHWVLTPHYNKAHHDHFHIELRDGGGEFMS